MEGNLPFLSSEFGNSGEEFFFQKEQEVGRGWERSDRHLRALEVWAGVGWRCLAAYTMLWLSCAEGGSSLGKGQRQTRTSSACHWAGSPEFRGFHQLLSIPVNHFLPDRSKAKRVACPLDSTQGLRGNGGTQDERWSPEDSSRHVWGNV